MKADPSSAVRRPWRGGPSAVALAFIGWAAAIPAFFAHRLLNADGDLASHLFLGRKVLEHGVVIPVDWAFTRPDAVFVAYEWLSESIMVAVESALGLAGIVALATTLVAGSVALATAYLGRRVEPFHTLPVAMLIAVLTASHWSARPHLFSFACLSALLCLGTGGARWRAPAVGLLFAAWANLHPAFLYGLAVYAAYLAGEAIEERSPAIWRANAVVTAAAAVGTLVNPLGWGLHARVLVHLSDREAFRMVDEFLPPSLGTVSGAVFLLAIVLLVGLAVVSRRLLPLKALLPLALAIGAALVSARFIPLFALFAFPVALRPLLIARAARPASFAASFRSRLRAEEAASATAPWIGTAWVALVASALLSSRGVLPLLPDEFSPGVFPVAAVEFGRAEGLTGTRIFHEYTWGGYLLYAWPGQPIYIDGMANLFGSDLMREYRAVREGLSGWSDGLNERGVGALLLEPGAPLVRAAQESAQWRLAHATGTAFLFTRRIPVDGPSENP